MTEPKLSISCPHCGKMLSIPSSFAGQSGRCVYCQEIFQVPPTVPTPAPARKSNRNLALTALWSGIANLLCFAGLLSPLPIVTGHLALSKSPKSKYDTSSNRKAAGIGLILGYIGACLFIIFFSGFADSHRKVTLSNRQEPATDPASATQDSTPAEVDDVSIPPLGTVDRLELDIKAALRASNRDMERPRELDVQDGSVKIVFPINDNLTKGLITRGAYIDIRDTLKAIQSSEFPYASVTIEGTFPLADKFGNSREDVIVRASYYRATIDRINWENFLTDNVIEIADSAWTHPAMSN